VVQIIVEALKERGAFYNDGARSYLFLNKERALLPLGFDEPQLELVLNKDYGLYPSEHLTKLVIDALRLEGLGNGSRTDVHAFSYYDCRAQALYLYNFAGGVYRLTPNAIKAVDNGTDGVLFRQNPLWKPFSLGKLDGPTIDWQTWLLKGIRFVPAALSDSDQRLLLVLWVLTLFFPQLFPTRVILTLIGEKGSGKSSLLRRVGQLLFGDKFNVTALTSKPDDFDAAITTDPFVVADNADDAPRWFPDKLAIIATGGTIKRRLLYTTNQLGDFPIVANLAITSRTPNFQREDVAERLLPLHVERIEQYGPEAALLAEVQAQRDVMMTAIVRDVQRALIELHKQAGQTYTSRFRMADFADFIVKIAPVVSTREEIDALLGRLSQQQVAFASEDEPLLDLIDRWLVDDRDHVNVGREISISQLGSEIAGLAASPWALPWSYRDSKSFGQYFRARKGTLKARYGLTERGAHSGTKVVAFHRLNGDLGDLGDRDFSSLPTFQPRARREQTGEIEATQPTQPTKTVAEVRAEMERVR
jgi:hypothetical protein